MMNNNANILDTIRNAVMVQHLNPNSQDSRNAQNYLNDFQSSVESILVCMQLISHQERDEIKHYALQTINSIIASNWDSFDEEKKIFSRNLCINLINNGTKDVLEEKLFLKAKVVQIITTVVFCDWPKNWAKFFNHLLDESKKSEKSLELVLMIIKNMRNECEMDFKLPLKKRDDIKRSLRSVNNDIYALIEATIDVCVQRTRNLTPNSLDEKKVNLLINTSLEALIPNIQFPLQGIFKDNIVDLLCVLAKEQIYFKKAFGCLTLIVNKKSIVPPNISSHRYKAKLNLIWLTVVEVLETLTKESQNLDNSIEYYETLFEISRYFVTNHKNITYRKEPGKPDTRLKFIILLTQIFNIEKNQPLISLYELWKVLFEVKFFLNISEFPNIKIGLFKACLENMEKMEDDFEIAEDFTEVKQNINGVSFLLMRHIMLADKKLFVNLMTEKLQNLVAINSNNINDTKNKYGFCTKESRLYNCWSSYLRVFSLLFCEDCFSLRSFNKMSNKLLVGSCEKILQLLFLRTNDPLINELVVKNYARFHPLFFGNVDAFKAVIENIFSLVKKFQITPQVVNDPILKPVLASVRRSAVAELVSLSRRCSSLFVPIFDIMVEQCMKVMQEKANGEDLSKMYEFLLNISDDEKLKSKRNEMIRATFKNSIESFLSPQNSYFLQNNKIFELVKNTPECTQSRQSIRASLLTIISLLKSITKATISYSNDYRKNKIVLPQLNSFQHDEVWVQMKTALPAVAALCLSLDMLHDQQSASDLNNDLQMLFFRPESAATLIKKSEADFAKAEYLKELCNWMSDARDAAYGLLSLSCNLSDSFFTSDADFIKNTILSRIPLISARSIKSLTERLISPFTIRCSAAVPQYFESFLAPILGFYFEGVYKRLCDDWNKEVSSNNKVYAVDECEMEVESQDQLRLLTRSVSKLIFSFSLEMSLQSMFDNRKPQTAKNKKKQRGRKAKPKESDQFRLNKLLYQNLLGSKFIFQSLYNLLIFFFKCPDSISRNNIYRFLHQTVSIVGTEQRFVELLASLMVEAIKIQPMIKEVDMELVCFISSILNQLTRKTCPIPKDLLRQQLAPFTTGDDLDFLLNAFLSRGEVLQRKSTKQFMMKISGEDATEIVIEKTGVLTNSVSKRQKNRSGRRTRKNYLQPTDLNILFDDLKSPE